MADQNKHKRSTVLIGIIAGVAVIAALVLILPQVLSMQAEKQETVIEERPEHDNDNFEELAEFLEDERYMDTLSCFYYPDSDIRKYQAMGDFLYILLEVKQDFSSVEEFYRDKKIQSIWTKSQFYEKSLLDAEYEFLEDESVVTTSKYTYHSTDKDSIVNVLVSGMDEESTQVMVIYWEP